MLEFQDQVFQHSIDSNVRERWADHAHQDIGISVAKSQRSKF
jgi:hypothetical protein